MGWFNDIKDTFDKGFNTVKNVAEKGAEEIKKAAEKAAEETKKAAEKAADEAKRAAGKTAALTREAAEKGADSVKHGFLSVPGAVDHVATTAWEATSDEARAIGTAIESTGMKIGTGFIDGGKTIQHALETGAEKTGEGLVDAGKYISRHACDLAIGSALSAVFVALSIDGEEEAAVGALAALSVTQFADKATLNTAARGLARLITAPVAKIPGVEGAVGGSDRLTSIITFIIVKACSKNPKLAVGTAGQFLAGAIIYGLTSVVCEGEIPGGYSVWKGTQASIPHA